MTHFVGLDVSQKMTAIRIGIETGAMTPWLGQEPRQGARQAYGPHPFSLTLRQQAEASQRRAEGATLKDLARSYNVSMAASLPAPQQD